MAFAPNGRGGPSMYPMFSQASSGPFRPMVQPASRLQPVPDHQFDIIEWYPKFQECVRYFLNHGQHNEGVQALAAFLNIQLPFQRPKNPVFHAHVSAWPAEAAPVINKLPAEHAVSLNPYIRRLVATGFDKPAILQGFFGNDWVKGVGDMHELERRNYLFAAKSSSWSAVKDQYSMTDDQTVPFLKPLQDVSRREIASAEDNWSEWLAMQDWMLGPLSPGNGMANVKNEDAE